MTIWNGTDPLQPDHEVAYRWWPTKRCEILHVNARSILFSPVKVMGFDLSITGHNLNGRRMAEGDSPFDLIPLQQQEQP